MLFDGGLKADFVFYSVTVLRQMVESQTMPGVYQRGYFILVDKDGLAARLPPAHYAPPPLEKPTIEEFTRTVNAFWYGAVYIAKQLRRRELPWAPPEPPPVSPQGGEGGLGSAPDRVWVAKYADGLMKNELLTMLAWHVRATRGWDHDTWHNGRFMGEWVDAATWQDLQAVFGRFEAADAWRALLANLELFRRLATEAAQHLAYDYPRLLDERVTHFVNGLYAGDALVFK